MTGGRVESRGDCVPRIGPIFIASALRFSLPLRLQLLLQSLMTFERGIYNVLTVAEDDEIRYV